VAVTARGGGGFERLDDGSLLVVGPVPDTDLYTIRIRPGLPLVSGLRLESLTHESLPAAGPGRAPNGNYIVSSIGVGPADATSSVPRLAEISRVQATHVQPGYTAEDVVRGEGGTGWAGQSQAGALVVTFGNPISCPPGGELTVTLGFSSPEPRHMLGRFRLATTSATVPSPGLPGVLLPDTGSPPARE
jgi:hypothetical protein